VSVQTTSASVAEAAQCDLAGQHTAALRVLSEAARRGDADAMACLGKRHLVAFHVPYDPQHAVEWLTKAANLGSAEAAAQCGVLAAIGLQVPQSWQASLGAIVFAAERGFAAARGQLCVLAGDRALAARCEARDVEPRLWGQLASSIDLGHWHNPAEGANLHDDPLVRHFPDFATGEMCDWMIANVRGRLVRARVYDAEARREVEHADRNNTWAVFNLTHSDLVSVLLQVHICASTGVPFRYLEPAVVLHYDPGEQIKEHFDFVDPNLPHYEQEIAANGQRIVTFLVYLNDDYLGGETELPQLRIAHKGRRGEGLFFVNALPDGAADTRTIHAGRPTSRGEKWIVSQFIRNRPTF
jgi:hypothetical protein